VEADGSLGDPTDLENRRPEQRRSVIGLAELLVEILERIELHGSPIMLLLLVDEPCVRTAIVRRVRDDA
jgi:hypothetical protein